MSVGEERRVRRVRVTGRRFATEVWLRGPDDRVLYARYGKRRVYFDEGSEKLEDGSWRLGPRDEPGATVMILSLSGGQIVGLELTAEGHQRCWESAGLPVGPCCGFW